VIARIRHLVLPLLLGSCLLLPATAAASSAKNPAPGCASAICVYHEEQPTPTGDRVLGTGSGKPAPLSAGADKALNRYKGADKTALKALATSPAYGIGGSNAGGGGGAVHGVGSLDLGTGGTALLVLLAISAGLVVLGVAVRLDGRR
jgi:hypothetical protein